MVSKKIYVGDLPFSVDDKALRKIVEPYGEVLSVRIIQDQFSGQSKGYAFVEMKNTMDAITAIEKIDGLIMEGRAIKALDAQKVKKSAGGARRRSSAVVRKW